MITFVDHRMSLHMPFTLEALVTELAHEALLLIPSTITVLQIFVDEADVCRQSPCMLKSQVALDAEQFVKVDDGFCFFQRR
jgi:hypothetical protein